MNAHDIAFKEAENEVVLKIVYLSPYFWPEEIGSAPYCTDLARLLRGKGHDLNVVAFRPHYPKPEPFIAWADGSRDSEEYYGVNIARVPNKGRAKGGAFDRLKNDLRYLGAVVRRVVAGKISKADIVVAYVPSIFTLYAAKLVKVTRGSGIVAVVHDIESGLAKSLGLTSGRALTWMMRLVERVGLSFADEIIVLTEGMKSELIALGCARPITVLPIWTEAMPIKNRSPEKPLVVGYSGNFGKKQNLDQLIPLIVRLAHERPEVRVLLRGDGSEKNRIKSIVEAKNLSNVVFEPLAPSDRFVEALQSIDVHLIPQALNVANYALPSKLFSIMAAGRTFVCIAPRNTTLDKFTIQSGAGFCALPDNEEDIWGKITTLLDDSELREKLGSVGRDFVEMNMNREVVGASYESILLNLYDSLSLYSKKADLPSNIGDGV